MAPVIFMMFGFGVFLPLPNMILYYLVLISAIFILMAVAGSRETPTTFFSLHLAAVDVLSDFKVDNLVDRFQKYIVETEDDDYHKMAALWLSINVLSDLYNNQKVITESQYYKTIDSFLSHLNDELRMRVEEDSEEDNIQINRILTEKARDYEKFFGY